MRPRARQGPEAKARTWVKRRFRDKYGKDCWVVTTHQGPYGQKGVPDLIICVYGIFVVIEMKSETGVVTEIQKVELERISKAGGIACVIRGKDEVRLQALFRAINHRAENILHS